jgi:small GTP-binding protein
MTTPTTTTLEGPIATLREKTVELLGDIALALNEAATATETDTEDDVQRLREIAQDLRDMFFIVAIIGEFNAGKSTFVNALIGEKLLPMGITPTTEYIELIRYAEEADRTPEIRENGALRRWAHPNTGAPGVAIVDTPGTGSVFEKHESIAKRFLHRSDLVIFIISAKHAYAENERLYLELAKKFGKKIVIVLNQVDLLKDSEQLEVRRFVENQLKKTLDIEPLVFMVSGKEALEGLEQENAADDAGNMSAVKAHLRGVYSQTPPAKQKLLAQLETAHLIVGNYLDNAKAQVDHVATDLSKVQDVQRELEQQSLGLETRMKEAGANIDNVLEGIRKRGIAFIDANLTLRNLRGVDRNKLQADFEEEVIGQSLREINGAANDYINAVVDQSRLYWRNVIDRLNRLQDIIEAEAPGLDSGIYAEQRESLQEAIRIAEAELKSYSSGRVVADMKKTFDANMGNFQLTALLSLSGLIVAVVAFLTPGIPGLLVGSAATGPLAPLAFVAGGALALGAGIPATRYVRRLSQETKDKFNERVDTLIKNYHEALDELTRRERNRLTQYGNQILTPVFSRLEVLSKRYSDQQAKLERYHRDIADIRQRVEELDQ